MTEIFTPSRVPDRRGQVADARCSAAVARGIAGAVAAAALLLTVGCSSDPPETGQPAIERSTKSVAPPRGASPARPETKAPSPAASIAPARSLPAGTDPSDVFEIVSDQPLYDIVAQVPRLGGSEPVTALLPAPGADSSQFIVERVPATGGTNAPPTEIPALPGFRALPAYGVSSTGLPLRILCEKDNAEMALVPAGISTQGSNAGPENARPEHAVFIDSFYMDVTEVTATQFELYRADQRSNGRSVAPPLVEGAPSNGPATGISWGAAQAYARWARKELPTEAEWEKAARGEEGYTYPWGNGRPLWGRVRSLDEVGPVGVHRSDISPFGIADLAGNAREWVADWYADDAYVQATSGPETIIRNPTGPRGPSTPNHRVLKGNGPNWTVWHRSGEDSSLRDPRIGFRCVIRVQLGR